MPLGIAHQEIGPDGELFQGVQDGRRLAEGEEPRNVRKICSSLHRHLGDGGEVREADNDHGGASDLRLGEANINPADSLRVVRQWLYAHACRQIALNPLRFFR